jgi:predicted ABC-type ATPase
VTQGGHDVPSDKLHSRYPRTLLNLKSAIMELPQVLVYDNDDLAYDFRFVAAYENGIQVRVSQMVPTWFSKLSEHNPKKPPQRKRRLR